MAKPTQLKNVEDYDSLITRELEYYAPMAADVGVSTDLLVQAAKLGVRDGIHTHRSSKSCKNREEECVAYAIRHFIDITLVRASLMASSEEEMEKAESVLMKLIED